MALTRGGVPCACAPRDGGGFVRFEMMIAAVLAMSAAAGPAMAQRRPVKPAVTTRVTPVREAIETPEKFDFLYRMRATTLGHVLYDVGGGGGDNGFEPRGPGCPQVVVTHTDASFTGGSYVLQMGFVETEIAAAEYVLPAATFPVRIDLTEMIFAHQANVQTTTEWSILVWEGPPTTGSLVAGFSSDGLTLPHIVIPPGTNGVNVAVSVDPSDPEQIIVNDNPSHSFTIGYRIDDHNNEPTSACQCLPPLPGTLPAVCCPPASQSNAFPTTDTSGVAQPTRNWLYARDCPGATGVCAASPGWYRFSELGGFGPSGDWVIRATYTPVFCNLPPEIDSIVPPSATNTGMQHLVIHGSNFAPGQTTAQLSMTGQPTIFGQNFVVNGAGTQLDADFNLAGAAVGTWTMTVNNGTGSATHPFEITAPQPPTVTDFSPHSADNNATLTATVTGSGFVSGATSVEISMGTATTIDAANVTVSSATELTCDFDLRCAPTGAYACTVTTAYGTSTLQNALSVTALPTPTVFGGDVSDTTNCPSPFSMTVFGLDFQDGAQVYLTRVGQPDQAATSVVFNDSFSLSATFDPSGMAIGDWNIRVENPDCQSAESDPVNYVLTVGACVPTVGSITPNTANNHNNRTTQTDPTLPVAVTVGGSNFVSGAEVRLRKSGQPDIVATGVNVASATQITCNVNLYLVATGTWNVLVINPGGAQSNTNVTFNVTAGPAPTVSLVTPANPDNCDPWTATINGSNYLPGASARLVLSGQPDIVASSVIRNAHSNLTATFDLTGAAPTPGADKWDCIVTNPDNQFGVGVNRVNVVSCPVTCLRGDMNDDGLRDGGDIEAFTRVLFTQSGTATELCAADMAPPLGVYDAADLAAFVDCLVNQACPP